MIIKSNYSSDISMLMSLMKPDTIFLSSWNKDDKILPFPISRIGKYNILYDNEVNKYFFSDEFENMKKNIILDNIEFEKSQISANNFTFVSNGTIAAMLSILTILKEKKHIRALLLSPIYYIYIEMLKDLNADIFVESGYYINYEQIMSEIVLQKINLVIVNNPLFGMGICISKKILLNIQKMLLKNEGCLLIDNIYNGLKWNETTSINDFKLYKLLSNYDNFIIMESLAKNLYLNGIKHCSLFSNKKWIKKLEKNSVYICGSITAQQFKFINKLYSAGEHQFVINQLNKNIEYIKNSYNFLISLLAGSDFWLGECQSGAYCLLGIPRDRFLKNKSDTSIAIKILNKTNILTLPHDRYLFYNNEYYCFRVNLMINQNILFDAVTCLQKCFNI